MPDLSTWLQRLWFIQQTGELRWEWQIAASRDIARSPSQYKYPPALAVSRTGWTLAPVSLETPRCYGELIFYFILKQQKIRMRSKDAISFVWFCQPDPHLLLNREIYNQAKNILSLQNALLNKVRAEYLFWMFCTILRYNTYSHVQIHHGWELRYFKL